VWFVDRALETLIALAGMYFFLSVAGLAVVEAISSMLDMRAKNLKKGFLALLEDKDKADQVLNSPLIRSLGHASGRTQPIPSYVPSDMFATAVLDVIRGKETASDLATAAKNSGIPALGKMADEVGADAAMLKKRIEAWFDAGMERVAGQYKRSIQRVTRIVAIALAFALNADTLEVGQSAWNDSTVRQGAVLYSQKLLDMCTQEANGKLNCPGVMESGAVVAVVFPMGWTVQKWSALGSIGDFIRKLIGLLATALAASLGAPFWFDVLRRLAPGLRQTGPKPEETAGRKLALPPPSGETAEATTDVRPDAAIAANMVLVSKPNASGTTP
jgi:hypothetical protein